jgi:tetratricopeptide (TPR) repeat protein
MKKTFWLLPLMLMAALSLSGSLAFAQASAEDLSKQGLENLRNNMDAEAAEVLEQAATAAAPGKELADIQYALGYAYARQGKNGKAIQVLDELVAASPDSINGRYLLGISLIRRMDSKNIARGTEVLDQLGRENPGTIATMVANSAARLIHTQTTINYAAGGAKSALRRTSDLLDRFGRNPAPTKKENQNIQFSAGVYLMANGDLDGAQFEFDYLALKKKNLALNNGVTLGQIRSNLYYQSALVRLKEGGKQGGEGALKMMAQAEALGGGNEAANHHLKSLAYGLVGNEEEAAKSMAAVATADPEYAARIAAPAAQ